MNAQRSVESAGYLPGRQQPGDAALGMLIGVHAAHVEVRSDGNLDRPLKRVDVQQLEARPPRSPDWHLALGDGSLIDLRLVNIDGPSPRSSVSCTSRAKE